MESAATTVETAATADERSLRGRWLYWRFRIFTAAWVLYACYYFCRKNFSVVMPMMARTSHYNNFDLAHAVFVFSLAYAVGQFVAGALGDRFGGRDHSTVVYGVNKIERLMQDGHDRQLHDLIQLITSHLQTSR